MELLSVLFSGWEPNKIFGIDEWVSVDMAELIVVFGTIAASMAAMVAFGNWWSR